MRGGDNKVGRGYAATQLRSYADKINKRDYALPFPDLKSKGGIVSPFYATLLRPQFKKGAC